MWSPKAITGDFNAWAFKWGSNEKNAKGRSLLKAFAQLGTVQAIENNETPDPCQPCTGAWYVLHVSKNLAYSDHQIIIFTIWRRLQGNITSNSKRSTKHWASKILWKYG